MPPKQASESETYSISSYPKVELWSPIALHDALAAASSSVELLSPIALHDALAAASFGFWLFDSLAEIPSSSDRLGTIDLPCATGGVFQCRAIVPNSSPRRACGGVFRFSAV